MPYAIHLVHADKKGLVGIHDSLFIKEVGGVSHGVIASDRCLRRLASVLLGKEIVCLSVYRLPAAFQDPFAVGIVVFAVPVVDSV